MDGHLGRKKSGVFVANLRNSLICLGYCVGVAPQIRLFFIPMKSHPNFCRGSLTQTMSDKLSPHTKGIQQSFESKFNLLARFIDSEIRESESLEYDQLVLACSHLDSSLRKLNQFREAYDAEQKYHMGYIKEIRNALNQKKENEEANTAEAMLEVAKTLRPYDDLANSWSVDFENITSHTKKTVIDIDTDASRDAPKSDLSECVSKLDDAISTYKVEESKTDVPELKKGSYSWTGVVGFFFCIFITGEFWASVLVGVMGGGLISFLINGTKERDREELVSKRASALEHAENKLKNALTSTKIKVLDDLAKLKAHLALRVQSAILDSNQEEKIELLRYLSVLKQMGEQLQAADEKLKRRSEELKEAILRWENENEPATQRLSSVIDSADAGVSFPKAIRLGSISLT